MRRLTDSEIYDGYGEYEMVKRRFVVDRKAAHWIWTMGLANEGDDEDFDLARFVDSISPLVEPADEVPTWSVHVEYSNHTVQDTACYDGDIFDKVEELHLALLEYFEPD